MRELRMRGNPLVWGRARPLALCDNSACTMALDVVARGMIIGWVGVHGPLMRLEVDEHGGRLTPRWRWLGCLVFWEYSWAWSDVERVDVLRRLGSAAAVHVRLVASPDPPPRGGVAVPWVRAVRGFVVALREDAIEDLLVLVPATVPRTQRGGWLIWG